MKQITIILFLGLLLAAAAGCQNQAVRSLIAVEDAWIRLIGSAGDLEHTMDSQSTTPEAAVGMTTAAFLNIKNSGTENDRLLRIETDLAQAVEIHLSEIQNDVMTMRPVAGIDIPAGETVELKPGGYHIMLIRLQQELKPGEIYPLTLVFEKAGTLIVEAEVRAP